jgi:plastocyanin
MKRLFLPLALVASLAAAGCGSSGSSSGSSKSTPAVAPAPTGGGVTIDMKNIAFSPKDATAKVGQKVTWTNKDSVDHNVVAGDGSFKSNDFGQNGTYTFTPKKAGKISYQCTLHPGMTATLTVTG